MELINQFTQWGASTFGSALWTVILGIDSHRPDGGGVVVGGVLDLCRAQSDWRDAEACRSASGRPIWFVATDCRRGEIAGQRCP